MRDHRRLTVWQKACDLAVEVYGLTTLLPASERFGLTSQMQRAAVSVPSNIAEGSSRESRKEFARFLNVAASSCSELETQIYLVGRLELAPREQVHRLEEQVREVRRMLSGLLDRVRRDT